GQSATDNLGKFYIDSSGNVSVSGTLRQSSLATLQGGFISNASSSIGGTLSVSGATTVSSTFLATGLATLQGGFISNASSSIGSSLNISGNLNASSTLFVAGNIIPGSNNNTNLGAYGTALGSVYASGTLDVYGTSSFSGKTALFNAGQDGSLGNWKTNDNALPAVLSNQSTVVANGYVYLIGGITTAGSVQSTVYYAKLNSDGSVGAWSTNTNALPAVRAWHSSVVVNGYIYVFGGDNGSGVSQSTVYYAKLNSDGSVGAWSTNTNALPAISSRQSSVVANGYVYVIGGYNTGAATVTSTVSYAKLNSDGSVGAWTTDFTKALPVSRYSHSSVVANGYVYAIGGVSSGTVQSTVYYAKLNSDGSVGAWTTNTNALTEARTYHSSVVANGNVYVMGGQNPGFVADQSTVYYAKLNSDGSVGAWSTNTNALPDIRSYSSAAVANGYVYMLGGKNSTTFKSTAYYASTARVLISGDLDLLGSASTTLSDWSGDNGSTGGSIYAGNIFAQNRLEVSGNTQLFNGLSVIGNISASGTLQQSSLATLQGGFISNASSSVGAGLQVAGAFNASSTFQVGGASVFGGALTVNSSNLTTLGGGFIANASSSIGAGLQVAGVLNASSSLLIANSLTLGQSATDNLGKFY
ncbi:hypothetical protein HY969_04075, partial [Candidatus Kaiserbacteria bacterium]|nr:hypothetical protein [Candidatus Kaiserbacteria bacterium]